MPPEGGQHRQAQRPAEVLQAADEGRFLDAVAGACAASPLLPVELYEALSPSGAGWQALDAYLRDRCTAWGGRRLLFNWQRDDGKPWLRWFAAEGDGIVRSSASGVELATLGRGAIALRHGGLPDSGELVVHILASFPSNVANNFYVSLEGKNTTETLRFSNSGVALAGDNATLSCHSAATKLYTLHAGEGKTRLYINGVLVASKARPSGRRFSDLVIRLVGDPGADLGGFVQGVEIVQATGLDGNLFGDDRHLYRCLLEERIRQGETHEVYQMLSRVDEDWAQDCAGLLLGLLERQLAQPGVREWVFDTVLRHVPPHQGGRWIAQHRGRLPAPVLSVRNLSCRFMRMPNMRFSISAILRRTHREHFLVLDNINFEVFPGDIVGIIGANGAGKSTLLKAIAGLLAIQRGEIVLRTQPLLVSVGLGARNELTGRENIYLVGTFMGLAKAAIDKLFDEIWEFSELGEAIDKPFKYYSDGMRGRLVFSLATSVSPDLLLLDELLSAGDIKFQKKAAERMDQLIGRAKSVIVVTHGLPFVAQRCNKALLISGGRLAAYGDPQEVISHYLNELHLGQAEPGADFNPLAMPVPQTQEFGYAPGGGMR